MSFPQTLDELRRALEQQPCECKPCSFCKGTGAAYFDIGGRYTGPYRTDDLSDREQCEECRDGIAEECERCIQLRDCDEDDEHLQYRAYNHGKADGE